MVLSIKVHDLQKQRHYLISRAGDEGVPHNAYDEVNYYLSMLQMNWSSEGMSWLEARGDPEIRMRYNSLLA
jgi:hypothetical protein